MAWVKGRLIGVYARREDAEIAAVRFNPGALPDEYRIEAHEVIDDPL